MNAAERSALTEGLQIYAETTATVDERTLEILDRRRESAVVKRRGWIIRRMLLAADLVGLFIAILFAEWVTAPPNTIGIFDEAAEIAIFAITLPAWVFVAKLYGLYDHDEERTDHSTVDEFSTVFHMITVWWIFAATAYLIQLRTREA